MRFNAAPPQLRLPVSASAGSRIFGQAQCTACHMPVMHTGANPVVTLANQAVNLFSDLLLHDMGLLGDGIEQRAAKGTASRDRFKALSAVERQQLLDYLSSI
jgi:CxxC motif-containing protein (DUF1111 family)